MVVVGLGMNADVSILNQIQLITQHQIENGSICCYSAVQQRMRQISW